MKKRGQRRPQGGRPHLVVLKVKLAALGVPPRDVPAARARLGAHHAALRQPLAALPGPERAGLRARGGRGPGARAGKPLVLRRLLLRRLRRAGAAGSGRRRGAAARAAGLVLPRGVVGVCRLQLLGVEPLPLPAAAGPRLLGQLAHVHLQSAKRGYGKCGIDSGHIHAQSPLASDPPPAASGGTAPANRRRSSTAQLRTPAISGAGVGSGNVGTSMYVAK